MASKENQSALNNLVYFADPFDRDEFNKVEIWNNTLQQAIDRLELVEKALDKACAILNRYEEKEYRKWGFDEIEIDKSTKTPEEWKEYLLEESEKQ